MEPAPFLQLPGDDRPPARAFHVRAEDGVRLRLALWEGPEPSLGTVLLFPGRTEYVEKYGAVARDLNAAGYGVLSLDWRGQGLSDRLLPDPMPGHIGAFADYQRDVIELVVAGTRLDLPQPWHLLAHSMGGCIGLAALHDGLPVSRAVFSAPMWGIRLGLKPAWLVRGAAHLAGLMGRGGHIAPQRGGKGYVLNDSFARNLLTSDVWNWTTMLREAASWPELTVCGASYGWIGQALAECRRLSHLPPPDLPALVAVGSQEQVVALPPLRHLVSRWPGAELLEVEGARHELMMETPSLRQVFMTAALAHFGKD